MVGRGGDRPVLVHQRGPQVKNATKNLAIAAVTSLAVLATLGEASSSGDGATSAPASAAAGDASSAPPEESAAGEASEPAEESAEAAPAADAWYTDTFGTFDGATEKGKGDGIVELPAGAAYGVVTATHKGKSNFSLSVLDAANQPTGDLLVNTIGNYKGVTAYGFLGFGEPGVKIKVTADGAWSVQVEPVSTAPALTLPAEGKGDSVFLYSGGASDWNVTHKGKSNFVLLQTSDDIMPNLAVNEVGNYKGQVPMGAGPSVVRVTADGTWSFSE